MATPTNILGIDPGLEGAIAWIAADGRLMNLWAVPLLKGKTDWMKLGGLVRTCSLDFALEAAIEVPTTGGRVGNVNALVNYGRYLAFLEMAGIEYREVASVSWKAHYKLMKKRPEGMTKDEAYARNKQMAMAVANTLFPHAAANFPELWAKDGPREAALIGAYWRVARNHQEGK